MNGECRAALRRHRWQRAIGRCFQGVGAMNLRARSCSMPCACSTSSVSLPSPNRPGPPTVDSKWIFVTELRGPDSPGRHARSRQRRQHHRRWPASHRLRRFVVHRAAPVSFLKLQKASSQPPTGGWAASFANSSGAGADGAARTRRAACTMCTTWSSTTARRITVPTITKFQLGLRRHKRSTPS